MDALPHRLASPRITSHVTSQNVADRFLPLPRWRSPCLWKGSTSTQRPASCPACLQQSPTPVHFKSLLSTESRTLHRLHLPLPIRPPPSYLVRILVLKLATSAPGPVEWFLGIWLLRLTTPAGTVAKLGTTGVCVQICEGTAARRSGHGGRGDAAVLSRLGRR